MKKDKLVLNNGVEIELEAGASLSNIRIKSSDRSAMLSVWEQLTPYNLSMVQIRNGEGLTIGTYTDLLLISETSKIDLLGEVITTYTLSEKTDEEKRLDALEEGQQVQDGAINDVAELAGTLAVQSGGLL